MSMHENVSSLTCMYMYMYDMLTRLLKDCWKGLVMNCFTFNDFMSRSGRHYKLYVAQCKQ